MVDFAVADGEMGSKIMDARRRRLEPTQNILTWDTFSFGKVMTPNYGSDD